MEYAPRRIADVFGDPTQPAILLWHGMQADARAVVRPLAGLLARDGITVVVPDWNSHADDGGRGDLLRSVEFTRKRAGDDHGIVLVGWSLGGVAAAGLTLDAARRDLPLTHTVCLAGAFMAPDPISGRIVTDGLTGDPAGPPFTLLTWWSWRLITGRSPAPITTRPRIATHLGQPVRRKSWRPTWRLGSQQRSKTAAVRFARRRAQR